MIYLSGVVLNRDLPKNFGFMLQPRMGNRPPTGATWAADNGCYSAGDRFDPGRWLNWLDGFEHPERWRCLFATAPDVVGDAQATWPRSEPHFLTLRTLGYHPALVAQDGFDPARVEWPLFDCLFLGGTGKWKLSPFASAAVAEAKRRGKWTHMGRVNSLQRLQAAALMGCDSADGTFLRFRLREKGPGASAAVAEITHWLRRLEDEPFLPLVSA